MNFSSSGLGLGWPFHRKMIKQTPAPLTVLSATHPLERKRAAERGGNRSRYNLTLFMLTLDVINLSLSRSSPSESSVGRWLLLRVAAEARSLGELSHSFGRVLRVGCVCLSQARSCWRCRE